MKSLLCYLFDEIHLIQILEEYLQNVIGMIFDISRDEFKKLILPNIISDDEYYVDWGDGIKNKTIMHTYDQTGIYKVKIVGNILNFSTSIYLASALKNFEYTLIALDQLYHTTLKNIDMCFNKCHNLSSNITLNLPTCESMIYGFTDCKKITEISLYLPKCTYASCAFDDSGVKKINKFYMPLLEHAQCMFGNTNLEIVDLALPSAKIEENIAGMFVENKNLRKVIIHLPYFKIKNIKELLCDNCHVIEDVIVIN